MARVGDDGSIMLSKINSGRLSEPSTSTTISSNSSSTSRDGEGTSTQRKHWTLRHKIDAASMAAESGEHVSNSENRGLVLWTGGDSHQVLLAQQQERRHMELTGRSVDTSRTRGPDWGSTRRRRVADRTD